MKLRYLFSIILSSVLVFASCEEKITDSWENIKLDQTYLSIAENGGSATLTIDATEDWAFVTDDVWPEVIKRDKEGNITSSTPSWLKADKMSGAAGQTKVTFTAEGTASGRELELKIKAGDNVQFVRVRQGSMTVTKATVAEIIAGPEGKLYEVTGVCTAVANTTYGNWYLKDDSSDRELYIYGTVDGSGKYNWASFNIEVGDVVTVQGSYVLYGGNTPEFVDATFIKVEKSLVKLVTETQTVPKEGAEIEVKVAYKGAGVFPTVPEEYRSWISVVDMKEVKGQATKIEPNPADTAVVKVAVQPNNGGNRTGSLTFVSSGSSVPYEFVQEGAIIETTADQINAAADGETLYRITGVVKSIANGTYGNIYIADYTGEVYVYGTYDAEGNRFDAFATPVKEGDIVTVCGVKTSYKESPQMKNVTVEKHIQVAPVSVADFLAAPVAGDVYYSLTGTMANIVMDKADPTLQNAYGNFDIVDESGSVYVYGLLSGWGGPKQMFRELNLVEGDKITIVGVRADYKGTAQVGNAFFVKKIEE